ncbi:hypothetical protein GRF29_154g1463753 [Pseudopithomyces chartarum]|uniref:Apple domain-containing protein n=1 Tax=Pseudopithomyces chartarum TaxID=1892770 RepID=A0AAN6RDY0_9PLEO|nr:hypothetical protein GRF29_154g1463753 [Pseudopithomyces chartarum]
MASYYQLMALLPLVSLAYASPLEARYDIFNPCASCFRSSWTQGPECKTDAYILSTMSRILNPPADATSTYKPVQWCSAVLRQTDYTTFSQTKTTKTTHTDHEYTQPLVTKTDLSHPTATAYCPIPSAGMECGWDTNTIAPDRQGQDWSVADDGISTPEECHQACLTRSSCKAYRWDAKQGLPCEIFNVGIGPGGANLINPTSRGNQWFDRACANHLPAGCKKTSATGAPAKRAPHAAKPAPAHPVITAAPVPAPELVAHEPALGKRDAPLPPYMEDLQYFWSTAHCAPPAHHPRTTYIAPALNPRQITHSAQPLPRHSMPPSPEPFPQTLLARAHPPAVASDLYTERILKRPLYLRATSPQPSPAQPAAPPSPPATQPSNRVPSPNRDPSPPPKSAPSPPSTSLPRNKTMPSTLV